MQLRILSAQDIKQALPMRQAIEVMRRAFGQLSAEQAIMPLRTRLELDEGLLLLMPAYLKESRELGLKMVTLWRDNPARGLPGVMALVTVFDPDTGQPVAIMNGEALTALRTGAGGGLAADLLARPEARVVTVFGAGVQARAQLAAVLAVRPIEEVRLIGRNPDNVARFAAEVRTWPLKLEVILPTSREAAVVEADIVITATSSSMPVFHGQYLSPGTHVTAVGSYTPLMQEVDEVTVKRSKIIVDSLQACLAEAGDLLIPLEKNIITKLDLHAELGQIVNGTQLGRESADEITLFKSVGVAVQDAAAASEVFRVAVAQNLGTVVNL